MRRACRRLQAALRPGLPLQRLQQPERFRVGAAAHILGRTKTAADVGAFRFPEQTAAVGVVQLDAAHAGRFAVRHP